MARATKATLVLFAAIGIGCLNPDLKSEWLGTVTDSASVRVVDNPIQGLWTPESSWALVEEMRIGVVSGDPNYEFGSIRSVDVDSAGHVFVLDSQAQHVRVFDSDGRFLRAVGGPGQGPGEIGPDAMALFVGPGDTLIVADVRNGRINRYDGDGLSVGTSSLPSGIVGLFHPQWNLTRNGVIVVRETRALFPPQDGPTSAHLGDPILSFGAEGTGIDTLLWLPPSESLFRGATGQLQRVWFAPESFWDLGLDGMLATATSNAQRVEFRDSSGTLTHIVNRSVPTVPVTDEHISASLEYFRREMDQRGAPASMITEVLGAFDFAEHLPAFAQLMLGDDGGVWLQRVEFSPDWMVASDEWDVFDPAGRYLGSLVFPKKFSPMKFIGDVVYGLQRDDLDVEYVLRLRIDRTR